MNTNTFSPAKNGLKKAYVLLILIGVIVILSIFSEGRFLRSASIVNVLRVSVSPLVVAVPATLLMITGNVDLSVGSTLGLVAVIYAHLAKLGMPLLPAMLIVLIVGLGCGWVNGLLVMNLNITPVIATLATKSLFLGIAKMLIPTDVDIIKGDMPKNMLTFAKGSTIGKIPPSMIVAIIIAILFIIMQMRSTLGKYSVAIGGNRTSAQLAGINVKRTVWLLYLIVGVCAAIAGITRASYMQAGDADVGVGLEVQVILAILLGGASFSGGKGSIPNTVAAVYIMVCLDKGLNLIGVEPYYSMLVNGIVFIGALFVDNMIKNAEAKTRKQKLIAKENT